MEKEFVTPQEVPDHGEREKLLREKRAPHYEPPFDPGPKVMNNGGRCDIFGCLGLPVAYSQFGNCAFHEEQVVAFRKQYNIS